MRPPQFYLFGFPIRFEMFFWVMGLLIVSRSGDVVWGATVVAVFGASVLVHELGHAFAFRRYGCESMIVIHGLGGYAFSPTGGRLTRGQHVLVSLAGPLVQLFLLGLPALALARVLPFSGASPVLGLVAFVNIFWPLVNLLPVLPLDGGNVMHQLMSMKSGHDQRALAHRISAVVAGLVLLVAVSMQSIFLILGAAYFLYKNIQAATSAGSDPIQDAIRRAQAYGSKDLKVKRVKNDQLLQLGWLAFQDGLPEDAALYAAEARTRRPLLLRTGGTELAAWASFANGNATEALKTIAELDSAGPFLQAAHMLHAGSEVEAVSSLAQALLGAPDVTGRSALVSESISTGHLESAINELLQDHGQDGLEAAASVETLLVRQGDVQHQIMVAKLIAATSSAETASKLPLPASH